MNQSGAAPSATSRSDTPHHLLMEYPGIRELPTALPDRWLTTPIFKKGVTSSPVYPPSMLLLGQLGAVIVEEQKEQTIQSLEKCKMLPKTDHGSHSSACKAKTTTCHLKLLELQNRQTS
ncbi:hypothetical protein ACFQZT_31210 [Paenibacillus sp. GCM10027628]|uniref:hypothetical protein n=1 Tax=Paenibacillus sp. GCM10027628 TaxID=3273413 RepID=UPI003628435A